MPKTEGGGGGGGGRELHCTGNSQGLHQAFC